MNSILELYLISKLVNILTTDWKSTSAYKLGIIDKNGKFLKKSYQLKSPQEKLAFSTLHRFAFNLKRLIETLPGGKSKLAKYLTVWALFKEETGNIKPGLNEEFERKFTDLNTDFEKFLHEETSVQEDT